MNKYYAVLGLPSTASKDEVKRAYRKLVLIWHPDKNSSPGASAKFMQITEAYDILMGDREAPRAATYSAPSYGTATRTATRTKSRAEQERENRAVRNEQLREKFYNMRSTFLRAPDAEKQKKKMYRTAHLYFVASVTTLVLSIVIPFSLIHIANLVWTLPVAMGAGMRLLWTGGRIKLRADMIYSGRTDYSMADIQEFFIKSTGFRFQSPSGRARWP